jgi:hypothetical protein
MDLCKNCLTLNFRKKEVSGKLEKSDESFSLLRSDIVYQDPVDLFIFNPDVLHGHLWTGMVEPLAKKFPFVMVLLLSPYHH